MSVEYCYKHHLYIDTDFEVECMQCVEEELEQEEQQNRTKELKYGII